MAATNRYRVNASTQKLYVRSNLNSANKSLELHTPQYLNYVGIHTKFHANSFARTWWKMIMHGICFGGITTFLPWAIWDNLVWEFFNCDAFIKKSSNIIHNRRNNIHYFYTFGQYLKFSFSFFFILIFHRLESESACVKCPNADCWYVLIYMDYTAWIPKNCCHDLLTDWFYLSFLRADPSSETHCFYCCLFFGVL